MEPCGRIVRRQAKKRKDASDIELKFGGADK